MASYTTQPMHYNIYNNNNTHNHNNNIHVGGGSTFFPLPVRHRPLGHIAPGGGSQPPLGAVAAGSHYLPPPHNFLQPQVQPTLPRYYVPPDERVVVPTTDTNDEIRRNRNAVVEHRPKQKVVAPDDAEAPARQSHSPSFSFREITLALLRSNLDRQILLRDKIICALSLVGLMFTILGTLFSWYMIHKPNQTESITFSTQWGCSEVVFLRPGDYTVARWMSAMKCTKYNATDTAHVPFMEDRITKYGDTVHAMNWLAFVATVAVEVVIVDYYRILHKLQVQEWSQVVMYSSSTSLDMKASTPCAFYRSHLLWQFVLEVGIHAVMPYPWLPDNYFPPGEVFREEDAARVVHTALQLCVFLRVYVVFRLVHHASAIYRKRKEIVASSATMRHIDYQIDVFDTLKLYMFKYTTTTLLAAHLLITVTGAFVLFLLERDHPEQKNGMDEYVNCLFTMFITIRTIGYGDYKAYTVQGRIATSVFATIGTAIEMLLGSVVINQFAMNEDESYVNEFLKSNVAWWEYKVCSAMLIQAAWKGSVRYKFLRGMVPKAVNEEHMRRVRLRLRNSKKQEAARRSNPVFEHSALFTCVHEDGSHNNYIPPQISDVLNGTDDVAGVREGLSSKDFVKHAQRLLESGEDKGWSTDACRRQSVQRSHQRRAYRRVHGDDPESELHLDRRNTDLTPAMVAALYKQLFTTDIDINKYRRYQVDPPPGFMKERSLEATKPVTALTRDGRQLKRRIPRTEGHKSNIILEALKNFRVARRSFQDCIQSSADSVLEARLNDLYSMLGDVIQGVHDADLAVGNLKHVADVEFLALRECVITEMGAVPVTDPLANTSVKF
eukprot:PhM_4_TR2484/c0_g1_i4/m.33948